MEHRKVDMSEWKLPKLEEQRPDLYAARLAESYRAWESAKDHVKDDALAWLMSEASSLENYLIREDGKEPQINGLLKPINLENAILIMRVAAWHFYANSKVPPSPLSSEGK